MPQEKDDSLLEDKEIDEAKASFGVDAEVPEPTEKKAKEPGKAPKPEDKAGNPVTKGSKPPKSKVSMINSIVDATKGMTKEEVESLYNKVMSEEAEEEKQMSLKDVRQISPSDVDISEDIAAMFSGQELSEDFVGKATTIFEAAVVSKVNEILETVTIDMEAELEAERSSIVEETTEKLNSYLDYVVEEWMEANQIAIDSGVRADIAENFMTGLKQLFTENYIDIPEEKVDVVEELSNRVEELETSINEQIQKNIELKKSLNESKKEAVIASISENLTDSQKLKLESLAEGVEFDSEDSYREKIETLKENYFPSETLSESIFDNDGELEIHDDSIPKIDPGMANYMHAISKSIKK